MNQDEQPDSVLYEINLAKFGFHSHTILGMLHCLDLERATAACFNHYRGFDCVSPCTFVSIPTRTAICNLRDNWESSKAQVGRRG